MFIYFCRKFVLFICIRTGHHEVPPLAHTTMLRDFPENLRRSGDVIPPGSGSSYRPVSDPVSPMHTFTRTLKGMVYVNVSFFIFYSLV